MILVPDLSDIELRATSDAERRVARLLKMIEGDRDAVAFHSVHLRSHATKQMAEIDFVILWRGTAVLVEVKGGGIRKHDGKWYSVDRHGTWNKLMESPMHQARTAGHALVDILQADGCGWFQFEAVVITPDIEAPVRSHEWLSTHWFSAANMTSSAMADGLDAVVSTERAHHGSRRIATAGDLRTRLFGEFTRMPVIDAQRGAILEEQNRATLGQARVLAAIQRNPRILVTGGAGTGKSLVLAEAAKQEADQRSTVLITFRSPGLKPLFESLIGDRNIDIAIFDEIRECSTYDVVLVDEAQDLMNASDIDELSKHMAGGRTDGRWRMFLDPNNQTHVDGVFDTDVLELVTDESILLDLDLNVRNTRAIVHVVQEYLGADIGDAGVVHGEKVSWHDTDGAADVGAANRVAEELVSAGVRRKEIWIVDVGSRETPFVTDGGIRVVGPAYAKGLEVENVIVCGIPAELDDAGISALYVAVTRARVSLHMVVTRSDRQLLRKLLKTRGELS